MENLETLISKAENLGWKTTINHEEGTITLQRYSPAGQDFSIIIGFVDSDHNESVPTTIANLEAEIDSFDVSEQAYPWLDNTGHGKNGAPDSMLDVYGDMLDCKTQMQILLNQWKGEYPRFENVKDVLERCVGKLEAIRISPYVPFASPFPSSNEKQIKDNIEKALRYIQIALALHNKEYEEN